MKTIINLISRWSSILNAAATFWLFCIMVIIVLDVIGRIMFNQPLTGTPEIVKLSIVGIVFIQLPHTTFVDRLIRSDAILNRMGPSAREIMTILSYLMGVGLCLAIVISSWSKTIESWSILEYEGEGALRVPVYPIRSLILLGAGTTALHMLIKIGQSLVLLWQPIEKGDRNAS